MVALGAVLHLATSVAGAAAAGPPALRIDASTLDAADLDRAVGALVEGLVAAKDDRRFWDPARPPADESSTQRLGWTAIVLLGLVEAGVSPQDPRIADAVAALMNASLEGTYAVSVRTMLAAILPDRHRGRLDSDVRWLLEGFSRRSRGWDYVKRPNSTREDNSINQFASLALADAAARGVDVPERLWELLEARTLDMQRPDGGWTYEGRGEPRGSMTAAGVATLFMLDRHLDPRRRTREAAAAAIERGLAWLAERFDPDRNPGHPLHETYWLFSLERAALAGGLSRLGGRDWFREGAASLIETLCETDPEGGWRLRRETPRGRTIRWHEHALGLLFLIRGRVPIALGVLIDSGEDALEASRLAGDVTEWMGESAEREFNWLRLDPEDPVDAWLEPAIVWWSPRDADRILGDEGFRTKLQRFLDLGGLLVANLGSLAPRERAEVRTRLGALRPDAAWRDVGESHPALSALFPLSPRRVALESLHDGVRDLIVLDESGRLARGLAAGPRRGGDAHEAIFNLWMLAVERDRPWPRLRRWGLPPPPPSTAPVLRLVDLRLDGTAAPEPLAPAFMARALSERLGGGVSLERISLGPIASRDADGGTGGTGSAADRLASPMPTLLLLRGVAEPDWPEAVWETLVELVGRGSPLLVESVGGDAAFATSVERELASRLDRVAIPLGADPILAGEADANRADLRRSGYRPSTARSTGAARAACRLRGLRVEPIEPRSAGPVPPPEAIFSTLDLSHAMLRRPREGIDGYDTSSATDLLERIARDLLSSRPSPKTDPP